MIRPWHHSRLFWIGILLIPLLSAAWLASELYPTVTILQQNHRYRELGHRYSGWSYLSVDRPSALMQLRTLQPTTFNVGSTSIAAWWALLDSYGFVGPAAKPSLSFQLAEGARYLPEEPAAQTAYFPAPANQKGDGWRYLFVPYWLLLPGFLVVWATALRAWQKRRRKKCT